MQRYVAAQRVNANTPEMGSKSFRRVMPESTGRPHTRMLVMATSRSRVTNAVAVPHTGDVDKR